MTFSGDGRSAKPDRLLAPASLLSLAVLTLLALVLRWSTFGDPDITADETFYHTVGLAMHHGALPYVDVWDRKPLGLFIVYWAITAFSPTPLAYQIAACASAIATAFVIGRIALRWTGRQGALLAGCLYLVWLTPLFGFGGQSPVFYNLPMAGAALLVLNALPRLRAGNVPRSVPLAMLLAGCAITIKTTALFESLWFGLACLTAAARSPMPRGKLLGHAIGWAAIGALPTLAIALYYAIVGHWPEFWHAMVTANTSKPADWTSGLIRLRILWIGIMPVVLAALAGLASAGGAVRSFVLGWLVAAIAGLFAVPNFYPHYLLPMLVVLCVAASPVLERKWAGLVIFAVLAFFSLRTVTPFRPGKAEQSERTFAELSAAIRAHDGGHGLLVYAGPAQLYPMTGNPFPTPLAFETHLSQAEEQDVSHLSTIGEMRRVLAAKPGAVVLPLEVRNGPVIPETWSMLNGYVRTNCRLIIVRRADDWLAHDDLAVWGDCKA